MADDSNPPLDQAAAFQKIWMDSFSKIAQAAFTVSPGAPPPDLVRQMRSGMFQAVAQGWEEFMRSPQFLESLKQLMDNAIAFRKVSTDFLTRAHHDLQAPALPDVDSILLAVRQLEQRVLDSIEKLRGRVDQLEQQLKAAPEASAEPKHVPAAARIVRRAAAGRKRSSRN